MRKSLPDPNRCIIRVEKTVPYYVPHIQDILDEIGVPPVRAFHVRIDEYVQEILGTRDLDADEVWRILYPKLQDPAFKRDFVEKLRARWEGRDWRSEGLG